SSPVSGRAIREQAGAPLPDDLTRLVHGKPSGGGTAPRATSGIKGGDPIISPPPGTAGQGGRATSEKTPRGMVSVSGGAGRGAGGISAARTLGGHRDAAWLPATNGADARCARHRRGETGRIFPTRPAPLERPVTAEHLPANRRGRILAAVFFQYPLDRGGRHH